MLLASPHISIIRGTSLYVALRTVIAGANLLKNNYHSSGYIGNLILYLYRIGSRKRSFSNIKIMKTFFRISLFLLIAAVTVIGIMFGPLVKGAMSVSKLDEGIYCLEFSGDDGFAGFLEQGGAADAAGLSVYIADFLSHGFAKQPEIEPVEQNFGCSTMAAITPDGTRLMGRNFDWQDCQCIIAKVNPKGGYRYISAFNPDFLGFGPDWKPEGFANQYIALATLFTALDGVNEKGLAVANLTVGENAEIHQDNGKPDLTTTCAIKYLLKTAASVDEAVALLEGIDFHSDIGALHHLSISDASGRSVVVEWVDDRMVVTDSPIVTNHYLCPENFGAGLHEGDRRFETLQGIRDSLGATMSEAQMLDAMSAAWQSWSQAPVTNGGTQWTALFNLSKPGADYIWQRDTAKRFHFDL